MTSANNKQQAKKMRVLLVTAMPPPQHGGITNWTRVVRRELEGRGDLELAFVDTTKRYRGFPRMQTLSRLLFGSCQALRVIYGVLRSLRSNRPDIVHLNTSGSLGLIRDVIITLFARMFKVPIVVHYHLRTPPAEITFDPFRKIMSWAMSLANGVVVLDKKSERCVRAALPDQFITILPTMVEIDVIDQLREKSPPALPERGPEVKIVFVGFITPVKGVRELVKACLSLSDQQIALDLIGDVTDVSLRSELQALVDEAGKAAQFRFHGGIDHALALQYMMAADFLVLPSYAESAPAVVIEAMGCGKPVVSTTTGAIPEMLDVGGPQECGICVAPGNVHELAAAMRRLITDPKLRQDWGRMARRRAEQLYSVQVGCKQLLDVWRTVRQKTARP